MKNCEHYDSECDCLKCDSFTCFQKRQKPRSCTCEMCKNSQTCILYPIKHKKCKKQNKIDLVSRGCNTKEVWQKTDKYHLGRDIVCSNYESKKIRTSSRDVCDHGKVHECIENESMRSNDKLCSQCEFKRNVLGCLNVGSVIKGLNSEDSSQDTVLCSKCALRRNYTADRKYSIDPVPEHVCRSSNNDEDHVCNKVDSRDANTNTVKQCSDSCKEKKSESYKGKQCLKCYIKQEQKKCRRFCSEEVKKIKESMKAPESNETEQKCSKCFVKNEKQKYRKYSFDDGKVYEFLEEDTVNDKGDIDTIKDTGATAIEKTCCDFTNDMQQFQKYNFDDGKVYEFYDNKKRDAKTCVDCNANEKSAPKIRKVSHDNGKVCEVSDNKKKIICSKCLAKQKSKPISDCSVAKDTENESKECSKCGYNKFIEPPSKLCCSNKSGNDLICNKTIKTIIKTEKDKIYRFKDNDGKRVEKKVSSKEFKKTYEKHFGKDPRVNDVIASCKNNKEAKRHFSAQVVNVSSIKDSPLKPCKCSSVTKAIDTQTQISKFDLFKRIKEIYDACKCKDCQCVASNDTPSCDHSGKVAGPKSLDSKYKQNLQFWEGFRAALNKLLNENPKCICKTCECVSCNDGQAKSCSSAADENPPASDCACPPCECRTNVMSESPDELSTQGAKHQNCQCQNCNNDNCVRNHSEICKCKKNCEGMKKPTTNGENNYDVRSAQVQYDRYDLKKKIETFSMFVKVPINFPMQNKSIEQHFMKPNNYSCEQVMENIPLDNNSIDDSCSNITCGCDACKDPSVVYDKRLSMSNMSEYTYCECDACKCLENERQLFLLNSSRLQMMESDSYGSCYYCQNRLMNPSRSHDGFKSAECFECLKKNPSPTETVNYQSLHSSSYLLAPTPVIDQEKETSHKSFLSYEIASKDLAKQESDEKYLASYKQSFYKEIFENNCMNISSNFVARIPCEGNCNGDYLDIDKKAASHASIPQISKEDLELHNTTSKESTTMHSIVNRIKSYTKAEKLLHVAKEFSVHLGKILQKFEEANKDMGAKSRVSSIYEEQNDKLLSRVNEYNLLSEGKTDKVSTERKREIWVVDLYGSNNGNLVYIPTKSSDNDTTQNYIPVKETSKYQQESKVDRVATNDTVHVNLRLQEIPNIIAEKKQNYNEDNAINKITGEMHRPPTLHPETIKPKSTKMDLELKDVNNLMIFESLKSESFKSYYLLNKWDSYNRIDSLEKAISFNNNFKVGTIEVQQVSTTSVLIRWTSPKIEQNIMGYELLIDGRRAQKIMNPAQCTALVTSLPKTEKVLLTIKTIMVTSSPIKYYPTLNSIYYPEFTKCQILSVNNSDIIRTF